MDRRAAPVFGLCPVQPYARLRRGPSGSASAKETPADRYRIKRTPDSFCPVIFFNLISLYCFLIINQFCLYIKRYIKKSD